MNKKKQLPKVKLQKSSVIFMQLGLILALFIVYLILEHESSYKPINLDGVAYAEPSEDHKIINFEVAKKSKKSTAKKKNKVVPKAQPKKTSDTFDTVKDNDVLKKSESVLAPTDSEEKDKIDKRLTVEDITQVDEEEDVEVPFSVVEFAPVFPGCTGTTVERKKCFSDEVNKIIKRNFNVDLAQELGLSAGKKRISIQFIYNKLGEVENIDVRAPHIRLKKEAKRLVKLLPKIKPARQGKNAVKMRFNLPIVFIVEE